MSRDLAGLVMAAGSSTRLGQPKQLVLYRNIVLVERAVQQALKFCEAGVIVVTGAYHEQIANILRNLPVEAVFNPDWREGVGSSVRAGVERINPDCRGIMLMLCDQPKISSVNYSSLVEAWLSKPGDIAAAEYGGSLGAPAVFPSNYREELMQLKGDQGAKRIIDGAKSVSAVEIPLAEFDIDTQDDLDNLMS